VTRKVAFETIRLMKTSKRNMRGTTWPLISGFRRITARSECYDRWGLAGGRSRLGDIRFQQVGPTVNGAMGNYSARGVMRGSQVCLALSSGGYVYYTVTLRASGDTLSGFYSSSVTFNSADQAPVTLRRLRD
jgi:hypothetical protein